MTEGKHQANLTSVAYRNAIAAILARLSLVVVGLVMTPFVLRGLGRENYGIVVAAGSAFEYLTLLKGGLGGALRRYVTLFHHGAKSLEASRYYSAGFWWAAILRTFILIVGMLLARPICVFFHVQTDSLSGAAVGVGLIIIAASISDLGAMVGIPIFVTGRTARLSLFQALMGWIRLTLIWVSFRLLVPQLTTYGLSLIAAEFLTVLGFVWLAQKTRVVPHVIPYPTLGDSKSRVELFRYGGLAVLSQAAALLYLSADNLMIGRIYGPAAVTHYSLGTRWAPLVLGFLVASVSSLTPLFTSLEARGEAERGRKALVRVINISSALAVPTCLVPCVVGDLFLVHWVGAEYRGSYAYLLAMLGPAVIEAALAPVWMALIARGRIGWIAAGDIIVAVLNVGLSLLLALVFKMGLLGFALGNTAALLAKNLILRPLVGRKEPDFLRPGEFLKPLPRALLGGAPGLLLLYLFRGLYGTGLPQVIAAGLLGWALSLAGSLMAAVGLAEIRATIALLRRSMLKRPTPDGD